MQVRARPGVPTCRRADLRGPIMATTELRRALLLRKMEGEASKKRLNTTLFYIQEILRASREGSTDPVSAATDARPPAPPLNRRLPLMIVKRCESKLGAVISHKISHIFI
jgi:hypothetical protein